MLIFTVVYTYYFRTLVDDELYNYGFSYNIINGLVPYKDFNMIITPLFSYLLALILKIFGSKLIIYHIVISLMIVTIFYFSYKSIGKFSFVIYPLLLIYPYAGYNFFGLMLFFILLYALEKEHKKIDIIEPILISIMFLTKQTLGLLVIPSLIFSKNRKKTLSIYLIFIFSFLIYLIVNGTVYQFFDYCLFGMFDFAKKNSTGINMLTIIEILIILGLTFFSISTKRKDIFFCLMFQIMTLPIINYIHFVISFIPVVYLILKRYKKNNYIFFICIVGFYSFFLSFNFIIRFSSKTINNVEYYGIDNFMKDRATYSITDNYILNAKEFIEKYANHQLYVFGRFAYLTKLNFDLSLTKYDIINNGNMGYNGASKYIKEIDEYCKNNKCLFIVNEQEKSISITVQTNMEIINYVKDNYNSIYNSNLFNVYIN